MPEELRAASLFQRVSPSVLTVGEKRSSPSAAPQGPTGTGFVWDASHVVTNFHVVGELKDPHVTFLRKVGRSRLTGSEINPDSLCREKQVMNM
ncbi:unnamed protein product [Cladocopium goreaui]|uniref:Serine protease n=1 Tax=Cladocopium goreaui TaxID=2562237 RepID=A0A9P1CK14_9DINO|nr:unnamed protein product [Cladocopium goreaui]